MTACYLRRDGLVLELLHFADRTPVAPVRPRAMDELGLTHLSLSCDVAQVVAQVEDFGGKVLTETDIGVGAFVRDPDGQLIELLPMAYAEHVATL
jgi:hypothetical protein